MKTPEVARSAAEAPRWNPPKAEPADSPEAIQAFLDIQADMKRKAETMEKETQGPVLEILKAIGELRTETADRIGKAEAATVKAIGELRTEAAENKAELQTEIGELRTEVAEKIGKAQAETIKAIGEVRTEAAENKTELQTEIGELRTETVKAIGEVRTEVAENKADLQKQIVDSKNEVLKHSVGTRWTMGTIIATGILLFAALSFVQSCS